jgi:hypothetical protein
MTANADTLYLPVLAPPRIETGRHALARENPQKQTWRPRIYRVPNQVKPVEATAYGANGFLTRENNKGSKIDTFA